MSKLHDDCLNSDTLTGLLLRRAVVFRPSPNMPTAKVTFESVSETDKETISAYDGLPAPVFELHALPLPKLDTVEKVEAAVLGLGSPLELQGHKLHGVFNFSHTLKERMNRSLSLATNVLFMKQVAAENKFYGPFAFIHPKWWAGNIGFRFDLERINKIEGIAEVLGLEALDACGKMALLQMTPDVIQLIVMEDRIVPRFRSDFHGRAGIVIAEW